MCVVYMYSPVRSMFGLFFLSHSLSKLLHNQRHLVARQTLRAGLFQRSDGISQSIFLVWHTFRLFSQTLCISTLYACVKRCTQTYICTHSTCAQVYLCVCAYILHIYIYVYFLRAGALQKKKSFAHNRRLPPSLARLVRRGLFRCDQVTFLGLAYLFSSRHVLISCNFIMS